jgi:hypothetical protein
MNTRRNLRVSVSLFCFVILFLHNSPSLAPVPIGKLQFWAYSSTGELRIALFVNMIEFTTRDYYEGAVGCIDGHRVYVAGQAHLIGLMNRAGQAAQIGCTMTIKQVRPGKYLVVDQLTEKVFGEIDTRKGRGSLDPESTWVPF